MITEPNTIKTLQTVTENKFIFRKTEGDFDCDYAVDYEMVDSDKLLCGIQIKPPSYWKDEDHLVEARNFNKKKNDKYEKKFDVEVFTITADPKGCIFSGPTKYEKQFAQFMTVVNNN